MSYQVLARKWRPKVFEELVGQSHVVTVLVNALTQQRLHHAYLFTGTRGVGKTTIARIFAKSLNCEQGITAKPCGQCDACIDIDQGHFVDLIEVDAASRTKVDDTREILDNVQYAPTRGRYKVYLIDEVHMLSRSSFNALLKTLEEPPEHVKFILATTDPQKLPVTILSRCLQFHLKALSISQIEQKVKSILNSESVTFEDDAITLLAKAAQGSMRDCLSLTDQSIAQGSGNILQTNVQEMLGGVDNNWVFNIIVALLKQDANALMKLSLDIASFTPSYSQLTADLIQLLHQIAMAQVVNTNFHLGAEQQKLLDNFCQMMSPEDVQLYYQIVLTARKDLPYAADEQAAFDMMLLRLLAFKPINNTQSLPGTTVIHNDTSTELEQQYEAIEGIISDGDTLPTATVDSSMIHQESDEKLQELQSEMASIEEQVVSMNVEAVNEITVVSDDVSATEKELPDIESSADIDTLDSQIDTALPSEHRVAKQHESQEPTDFSSPVSAAIATRNMLRSRKKALESGEKKSSDADKRQSLRSDVQTEQITQPITEPEKQIPSIEHLSEQPYCPDIIDPAKITSANQVDKWANMIDSMSLIARLRQLAIHATIDPASTDDVLILQLDQSIKHLNSDAAHKQLAASLSDYLQRKIIVELNIVEKTIADPYQIQADINAKRYEYATQLLNEDAIVKGLQESFQAELAQETIEAR